MIRLMLLAMVVASLVLAACTSDDIPPRPLPPVITCADECRNPCDTRVPAWAPPDARKPEAWDYIRPQVVTPLQAELQRCEQRRASCVACIDAAKAAGVIR